jgi:hypothetical protein
MKAWHEEKASLCDVLLQRVLKDRQRLCYRDLTSSVLPEVCTSALRHRARQIFSEHSVLKMHSSARFDLDTASVRGAFQRLVDEIIEGTVFSDHEIGEIIHSAIDLQYDIIVRPREKLLELLFHNSDICSKQDSIVVLSGFGQHRRFIASLSEEIAYWPMAKLKRNDLEELAIEVEKNVYKQAPVSCLSDEIDLLLRFESGVYALPQTQIRTDILLGILAERNLQHYRTALLRDDENDLWQIAEIESAMESFLLMGGLHGDLNSAGDNVQNADSKDTFRTRLLETEESHGHVNDPLQHARAGSTTVQNSFKVTPGGDQTQLPN